jgi:hypothetical protein
VRRRTAATAVDYALAAGWAGLLAAAAITARSVGVAVPAGDPRIHRLIGQAAGAGLLTVPVTVAFAACEARWGATPGKRLFRLRVEGPGDRPPSPARALTRSALKTLLPWELAHTAIWDIVVWPGEGGTDRDVVLLVATWTLVAAYAAGVAIGSGRTPYDRIAATVVRRHPIRPPADPHVATKLPELPD